MVDVTIPLTGVLDVRNASEAAAWLDRWARYHAARARFIELLAKDQPQATLAELSATEIAVAWIGACREHGVSAELVEEMADPKARRKATRRALRACRAARALRLQVKALARQEAAADAVVAILRERCPAIG